MVRRVTLDFETKKLEERSTGRYPPKPVGLAIYDRGRGIYHAWGHASENNCTFTTARNALKAVWDESLVFHNAAFDIEVAMKHFGLPWPRHWHDTLIMAYLADPRARSLGLKDLGQSLLGMEPDEQDELKGWILANIPEARKSDWGGYISEAPADLAGRYAIGDVVRTDRLFVRLKRHLLQPLPDQPDINMADAYERECRLIEVKLNMEQRGVRMDTQRLTKEIPVYDALHEEFTKQLRRKLRVTAKWEAVNGFKDERWNPDSNEDLADALEHAGYVKPNGWIMTAKSGKRSTSRANLEACIKDPQLKSLLNLRTTTGKYLSTFLRPWEAAAAHDGYIHPNFNTIRSTDENGRPSGTTTGRLSCVHADTEVLTRTGYLPIKDIRAGMLVWTHRRRWRPVSATWVHPADEMWKVRFSDGNSIKATVRHRILVDGAWVELGDLLDERFKIMVGQSAERGGVQIKEADRCGDHPIYDITVDEDGSYYAAGVFNHNSSLPNLQNIAANVDGSAHEAVLRLLQKFLKRERIDFVGLRDYFIPDEGCVFLNRDYSQQEFRILAHYENGPLLERYAADPRVDFHTLVQTMVQEASKKKYNRKPIKNINFGIIYGMGVALLADKTGLPFEEAKALKGLIQQLIPGIGSLQKSLKAFARRQEPISTHGGRLYYCEPDIIIKGERRSLDYKLLNLLIQGSAADCTKQAMLQVYDTMGPDKMALQVHDELMLSVPIEHRDRDMHRMTEAMEDMDYDVPMLTEGKWGTRSWARMEDYDDGRG